MDDGMDGWMENFILSMTSFTICKPNDRSQKLVMLSMGKIDLDEISATPNSKVETIQGLGFDNHPTYEEQLQSSNTNTHVH